LREGQLVQRSEHLDEFIAKSNSQRPPPVTGNPGQLVDRIRRFP
jgi:hypothetical protein